MMQPDLGASTYEGRPAVSEEWLKAASRPVKPARVDSAVPNVARVWNYLVGGRDDFEADRRASNQLIAVSPIMAHVAPVTSRAVMHPRRRSHRAQARDRT